MVQLLAKLILAVVEDVNSALVTVEDCVGPGSKQNTRLEVIIQPISLWL